MSSSRLEGFSDGVLAIIITIMVLELTVPKGSDFSSLRHSAGEALLTYLLTFVYIGIYWNNHHHLFQLAKRITGGTLWANLALLFCLSLFPFTTTWMGRTNVARMPVAVYGINLLAAAVAYFVLQTVICRAQGDDSTLRRALGRDAKGKASPILYLVGIACALCFHGAGRVGTWIALGFFVAVAIMWLVPDRRIERALAERVRTAEREEPDAR